MWSTLTAAAHWWQAAALAASRLALAPESELLADVCGRAEVLSAKLKAAKGRAVEVGNSLVNYERAATKMVSDAHAQKRKAEEGEREAKAEATRMASWEGKCAEQQQINDKLRGMWQAKAIRKIRVKSIEAAFLSWQRQAQHTKRGERIVAHAANKIRHRWAMKAWRGWTKFTQLAHVHRSEELAVRKLLQLLLPG